MGQQSPQSDLWSATAPMAFSKHRESSVSQQVGVILYILMTGEMPWSSLVSLEEPWALCSEPIFCGNLGE